MRVIIETPDGGKRSLYGVSDFQTNPDAEEVTIFWPHTADLSEDMNEEMTIDGIVTSAIDYQTLTPVLEETLEMDWENEVEVTIVPSHEFPRLLEYTL